MSKAGGVPGGDSRTARSFRQALRARPCSGARRLAPNRRRRRSCRSNTRLRPPLRRSEDRGGAGHAGRIRYGNLNDCPVRPERSVAKSKDALFHGERRLEPESTRGSYSVQTTTSRPSCRRPLRASSPSGRGPLPPASSSPLRRSPPRRSITTRCPSLAPHFSM